MAAGDDWLYEPILPNVTTYGDICMPNRSRKTWQVNALNLVANFWATEFTTDSSEDFVKGLCRNFAEGS